MSKVPLIDRRNLLVGALGATATAAFASACSARDLFSPPESAGAFGPEQFGAKGDGRTDDTQAFQLLSQAVSKAGGGTIVMRPRATYRVGRQVASQGKAQAFAAEPMLRIEGVTGLEIQGNGATLKLNDGLRYGSFDPASGQRFNPPSKGEFTNRSYAAVVGPMVEIAQSSDIHIADLILDGNMAALQVGGRWGDVEIQLEATGLQLTQVGRVLVEGVVSRNHGLDGVYIRGRNVSPDGGPADDIVLRGVRCDRNGRQGVSVVGGKGLRFERCTFSNTGQGPIASRPTAGVDLEPNGRNWTTDATFEDCEFVNNRGVGLLAESGNSRDLTVRRCTFWQGFAARPGVTVNSGDALWLGREGVRVEDCTVHGNITHMPASAQLLRTSFDNAVHPVFGRAAQTRPYLLAGAAGTYSDCTFSVDGGGQGLIWANAPLTLQGCSLRYAGAGLPTSKAVAFFSPATTLQDVTFTEGSGLGARHYIADNGAKLVGKVVVTGPQLRWHNPGGPVGNIAAGRG